MDHMTIRCEEMTGNIATVLLDLCANFDGDKVADLLMRSNEVFGEEFANAWV